MRNLCGRKLVDRKMTVQQMDVLGLIETVDGLAKELDDMDRC